MHDLLECCLWFIKCPTNLHHAQEGALSFYVVLMQHIAEKPSEELIQSIGRGGKQKWKMDVVAPSHAPPKPHVTLPSPSRKMSTSIILLWCRVHCKMEVSKHFFSILHPLNGFINQASHTDCKVSIFVENAPISSLFGEWWKRQSYVGFGLWFVKTISVYIKPSLPWHLLLQRDIELLFLMLIFIIFL